MSKQRWKGLIFTNSDDDDLLQLWNDPRSWVLVSALAEIQLHIGMSPGPYKLFYLVLLSTQG